MKKFSLYSKDDDSKTFRSYEKDKRRERLDKKKRNRDKQEMRDW
jgi:hypothetical protein